MNSRMYRGTWLLVGIPLLISAFTVSHPQPLSAPTLQPDFDGTTAALTADAFVNNNPLRVPGTSDAQDATDWVAERFAQYGLRTQRERFHAKIPGRGTVQLENLIALREGQSNQIIVVLAHRDNSGASPGANDNGSGTAALLELARSYATPRAPPRSPEPNHTILFLSTDGGAFGGLGATYFAEHSQYRERVVAVVNLDSIGGNGRPHLVFAGDEPRFASPALVRTGAARIVEQTGVGPTRPSALSQLLDLAFPLSLHEQAPFVGRDVAALTLTSGGDRPPSAFGDTLQRLNDKRLAEIGRSSQALLLSLDGEVELAEGTSSYVYLGARVVRGWSIVLILFTALLPCLAVIVDLFARLRRRHIPLAPALRSLRSRLLFWIFAAFVFEAFVYLGAWQTGAARPLAPELSPGTDWPVVAIVVFTCFLAVGWLIARDRLIPRRPLGDGEELAGQVAALLVLAVLSLLVVAMNPYAVIFVLPSLHAWIWLPQVRGRPAPLRAVVLVAGFLGPLVLVGSVAGRLGLGFDAPWYLAQLAAVGYVRFPALLVAAAWLAVAAQLAAIAARRYAPYPSAGERRNLGPVRRLVRSAVLTVGHRHRPEEERRATGP
ncbi:MAG TPA: M28 family peptidase [Gaiellaceae bacterium]